MFQRLLYDRLAASPRSLLLLGPRQVGKSTLLGALAPDRSLNLASARTFRDYVTAPERLEAELRAAPSAIRTVLIDEVQRIPELLQSVQVLVDELPGRFRFLLSGSSARKLRRGEANLLPGRVHVHHLHPLLERELGEAFDLERVLAEGSLPGIASEPDAALRHADLRSYADTYLREEVQAEALVRNLGGYARLLDLVAASSGRILNLRALSQEAGIAYETARRYLEVLEDTLLLFSVPAWRGSDRASLTAHPKHYLFDLGVRNAILRRPLERVAAGERGLLFEHLVALELRRRERTLWPELRLFHYRTRHGAEVDLIVDLGGGRELWAVEVKAHSHPRSAWLSGFRSLDRRTHRVQRRIIVFEGDRALRLGDAEVLPLREFLAQLPC